VANLTARLAGNETVNLNVPITVGTLTIGASSNVSTFTVADNGGSLTFADPSGTATLTESLAGGDTINAPLALSSALTIASNGQRFLTLNGSIDTGTWPVTLASGTLVVNTSAVNVQQITVAAGAFLSGTGTITPPDDTVVVTSFFDSAVYEVDAVTGSVQATLVAPYSSSLLSGPAGLAVGPDGNLYLSSQFNDSILQYNFATGTLSTFIPSSVLTPIAQGQGDSAFAPAGLTFDGSGNLYVTLNGGQTAFSGGAVVRFATTYTDQGLVYANSFSVIATGLIQPSGLTFGTAAGDTDSLYVSNSALGAVMVISGASTNNPTTSVFIGPGSGGLNFPAGLTFGPDGELYVADLGATSMQGQVLQFNPDGSFSSVFTPGPGQPGDLSFQFPSGILFDPQGHLLTANLGPAYPPDLLGSIYQFNSDGSFNQVLVSSSQFIGMGTSGISASQLAYLPAQPANFTVNGQFVPGFLNAPGVVSVSGNVTFGSSGSFTVYVGGSDVGTGYSQLVSTGTVSLNNAVFGIALNFEATVGEQFDIISDNVNPVVGTFLNLPEGATFDVQGQTFSITYQGGATGNDVVLTRVGGFGPGNGPGLSPHSSGTAAGAEDAHVAGFAGFDPSILRESLWAARLRGHHGTNSSAGDFQFAP
jgi:sugar lactone lactonase YvrE